MFHPNGHLNKHGFYEVGEEKFYSKLDAIKFSIDQSLPVTWNYNKEIFEQVNWTIEPEKSIQELYLERARALRKKYDYLVVMFSGGADSTTILDTFIDNDIYIDEIQVLHWISGENNNQESFLNAEITHSVMPYLKKKLNKDCHTKIRICDISEIMRKHICDPTFRERSYREINSVHNIGIISWYYNIHIRYPEYTDCYNQGKTVGFVLGESKPIVDYDTDIQKHFFYFEDSYPNVPQPRDQELNDNNCNYEHFYNDPEFAELKIKQCHLLLKSLKQIRHRTDIFVSEEEVKKDHYGPRGFKILSPRVSPAQTYYNNKYWKLDRNAYHQSIYPNWNLLTYHEDKSFYRVVHPAYQWLEKAEPGATKAWMIGFIQSHKQLPDEWINHHGKLHHKGIKRLTNA
jgi:hypothetical protein